MTFYQKILFIPSTVLFLFTHIAVANPYVRLETSLGTVVIELFEDRAPGTVANFLNYVNDGDYNGTIIHRSIPGFVVQGGGFKIDAALQVSEVSTDAAIINEFSTSNTRGTVAMAKLNDAPDSATSQWFVNLADNSSNLDNQNGGFTVFGRVKDEGMAVIDAIAALQRVDFGGALNSTPTIDFDGENLSPDNFVTVNNAEVIVGEFINGRLTFPVDAGESGKFRVAMNLLTTEPQFTVILDFESIMPLTEQLEDLAIFSSQDLTLTIPSVHVNGEFVVTNVLMALTDSKQFIFSLVSFE